MITQASIFSVGGVGENSFLAFYFLNSERNAFDLCDSQPCAGKVCAIFSVMIIVDMFYFTKFKLSSFCIEIKITQKKI